MTKVKCDNCQWTGDSSELTEDGIEDLDQRLDPGSVVPCLDGECPECGCLTYLVKDDAPAPDSILTWRKQLREEIGALGFAEGPDADVNGGDAVEYLGKLYDDLEQMIEGQPAAQASKPTAEDLAALLNELQQHCSDSIAYYPNEGEEMLLDKRVCDALDAFGGPS